MKKILIGILIALLIIMAYFAIFRGISIGSFQILSVEEIQRENDRLTQEITDTETLMHNNYRIETDKLEESVSKLLAAKQEYLDLAEVSTEGELSQANKQETYKIEYLWTRIGNHATSEGIILKLDITAGETGEAEVKNLAFTVTGNYIAVINFVRAIEDDSQLGFRIENFKILPGSDTNGRQATFVVRNVRIKQENSTATGTAENNAATQTDNQTTTTDNSNTQNTETNTAQ